MSRSKTPKTKSTLDFLSLYETRKRERGTRSKTRKVMHDKEDQTKTFVDLCNTDIMNTSLEFVEHKSWLSKGKVNIFIIGEIHSYRNYTETGIFEMFDQLVDKFKVEDTSVDIMLEISEGSTNRDEEFYMRTPEKLPDANAKQMNNVRDLFRTCIGNHNCGKIRAHWVDNMNFSIDSTYKTSTFTPFTPLARTPSVRHTAKLSYSTNKLTTPRFVSPYSYQTSATPRVRRALDAMPDWLITFYHDYDNHKYDDTNFQYRFRKGNDKDLLKLLNKNTIVVKELHRAAQVQRYKETPVFNLAFARARLNELIKSWTETNVDYDYRGYQGKIYDTARAVMDIYTVARIIKSNMKNVIIYEGAFHAENVVYMLTKLGYTTNDIKRQDVGPVIRKPLPVPVPSEMVNDPELLTDV